MPKLDNIGVLVSSDSATRLQREFETRGVSSVPIAFLSEIAAFNEFLFRYTSSSMHASDIQKYSSVSRLRNPLELFASMGRDLMLSRELAWRLFIRDMSAQYR